MLIRNQFNVLCVINLFLLATSMLACQENKQNNIKDQNIISSELLLQDIDTVQKWIYKAHGDPFRFTTQEKLNLRFEEARKKVKSGNSMTGEMFYGALLPIFAELRDGHSKPFPPNLDKIEGRVFFPLKFVFVDKKPRVIKSFEKGSTIPVKSEILEINNVSSERLFKELISLVNSDGNTEVIRYRRLENTMYFSRLLKVTGKSSEIYKIKLRHPDGTINEYDLKALNQKEYKELPRTKNKKPFEPIEFAEIEDEIGYLKVNTFNGSSYKKDYNTFIDSVFNVLNKKKVTKLILDLRGNRGGDDTKNLYLLRYLMTNRFSLYGELTFRQNNYKFLPDGSHYDIDSRSYKANSQGTYDVTPFLWTKDGDIPSLGEFDPFENRFKGMLIVLIDAFTFSSASECAAVLHQSKRGTFIGEETGGSYIGNVSGYTPTLDLPNSKAMVNVSLINIRHPFFNSDWTDRGVLPDIFIEPSVNDIITAEDVVLKKALLTIQPLK
jgi:C-terminal processing protease CtpA/Prc